MTNNGNMPAMPCDELSFINASGYRETILGHEGMSRREMMAMHMMQGILTGQDANEMVVGDEKCFAEFAVQCAYALLAELERTK